MKRAFILGILVISIFTMVNPIATESDHEYTPLVHENPMEEFVDSGVQNDVTVRFDRELTPDEIEYYERNGINFGDTLQNVGSIYIAKVSDAAQEHI